MKKINIHYFLVFSLLSFCAASVSSLIVFFHHQMYVEDSNNSRLKETSLSVQALLYLKDLETLKTLGSERSPSYIKVQNDLKELTEELDFSRIYVLLQDEEGIYRLLLDSQKSSPWEHFLDPHYTLNEDAQKAASRTAPVVSLPKKEKSGEIQSLYVSIWDEQKNRLGLLILDMDISDIMSSKRRLLVILIASIILSFFIPLFLLKNLSPLLKSPVEEAEKKAGQSEQRYRGLFEDTPISLWEEDFSQVKFYLDSLRAEHGTSRFEKIKQMESDLLKECAKRVNILEVNSATLRLLGTNSKGSLLGPLHLLLDEEHHESFSDELQAIWDRKFILEKALEIVTLDGKKKHVLLRWFVPKEGRHDFSRVIISLMDITEFKHLQNRLQQAQKMEALGQLAGGVAHDFNNLVCGIMGYADLCMNALDTPEELDIYLGAIIQASERAKRMVSKILSFSKMGGMEEMKILPLQPLIEEVAGLIRASASESLALSVNIDREAHPIMGNSTSMHEIIMNLCYNGIQAMQNRGTLTIALKQYISDGPISGMMGEVPPGTYSVLEVEDQGVGMDQTTLNHIFEPFYSTKKEQGGTGLGLAVVYGVIQTQKGNLQVESELGKGSRFRLFFPVVPVTLSVPQKL